MTPPVPDATELLPGRATRVGTRRFADRLAKRLEDAGRLAAPDHFARPDDLWLSSIALGTLRGDPGGVDDLLYRSAEPFAKDAPRETRSSSSQRAAP